MNPVSRRNHRIVLALYTFLTLVLTWPLVSRLTTHVPGVPQWAYDEATFLWNTWYFKHALVDALANPLHTELIWYPLGIDLVLYTYNFFHALVSQPLMLAVNLPFGSNVALLTSTVLSGYGTFLLVRYLLGRRWAGRLGRDLTPGAAVAAAFGAGLLYAFASNRAVYAMLGHYDMVTTQWIPFYALALLRSLDPELSPRRRRGAAVWAGFFMALNGLAEMITALFLAIFTLIVLAAPATRRGRDDGAPWPGWRGLATSLGLAAGTAAVVWSPVLLPILRQFLTNDFSLQGWGEALPLSVDLLGLLKPTVLHPLFGGDVVAELHRVQLRALEQGVTGFRDVNTVYLGWTVLALALAAAWRFGRRLRLWTWTALVFGLFALGPLLQIDGRYRFDLDGLETTFPLPFIVLHYLPIIKANRAPNRNSVLLMLGLAVLVGFALAWLLRTRGPALRRPQTWIAGALCGLILFEHLALPLPLTDMRVPAVYAQIAADPAPISVLQIPLGWRNSFGTFGPEATIHQVYQTVGGKPMLGGNISRAPDFKLDYFRRIALFQVLRDIQFGSDPDPALVAEAQAQAGALMALYNIGYVLLMPPVPGRLPYADHWQATWDFVKETLPLEDRPFWTGDGIEAYRVAQPRLDDAFTLDLGEPGTFPYRGEGWDAAETDASYDIPRDLGYREREPSVYPAAPGGPRRDLCRHGQRTPLRLSRQLGADGDAARQRRGCRSPRVGRRLADVAVGGVRRGADRRAEPAGTGLGLHGPSARCADRRARRAPGHRDDRRDAARGCGPQGVCRRRLYCALRRGRRAARRVRGRRGVNVTVLDPAQGRVLDQVGFDTEANAYESEALAAYLRGIPARRIVLIVSYGNASAHLTDDAMAALQGIGAGVGLADLQGRYFAMIGVQGATVGSAAVATGADEAFLSISRDRDRRPLAAAVDWVAVARQE